MSPLKFVVILVTILLIVACETGQPAMATPAHIDAVGDMWLDISMGPPLVDWFNRVAQTNDIARADHISQLELLRGINVGQKMVVFKSATDAEQIVPEIADEVDIIGYNLEHGPANPMIEQNDPVGSIQRMRRLADEYDLELALGPDHRFALSDGVAMAPYVDIFVMQVQLVQTEPARVRDFVIPLAEELRQANPDIRISAQVRTEGDVDEIVDLIASMRDSLDGISILTSPETVDIAEDLVDTLRARSSETNVVGKIPRDKSLSSEAAGDDRQPSEAQIQAGSSASADQTDSLVRTRLGLAVTVGLISGGLLVAAAALALRNRARK